MAGWRERWIDWRNARLADPAFQRWAARFPLTRPVARRRARRLYDVVAGFVYSQTLYACVTSGLLELLAGGARDAGGIASSIGVDIAGTKRLLRAAATLGLVEPLTGDRWALGGDGAALLGNAGVAEMVAHHRHLYADLADPLARLADRRPGPLARFWAYDAAAADAVAPYSALMAASQPGIAAAVLDAYDVTRHHRFLDLGGGQGVFAAAALDRAPHLAATVFDLPAVVARITDARITRVGGSFITDPLPAGADLVTLIRIVHDHDDVVVATLLARAYAALAPGGTLLLAEPMAGTPGAEPIGDAYFGLYLWAMGRGEPRTRVRLTSLLTAAGFADVGERTTALPLLVRVLVARRR